MLTVLAVLPLGACPEDKPIDFSQAKHREMPAPSTVAPRPTMPGGALPFRLPAVHRGPTLAFAPELVLFDRAILRKPTSSTNTFAGTPSAYVPAISSSGVAAYLDDGAGSIALFVNKAASATETLHLLEELKGSSVAVAADVESRRGQLPYIFGAADPTVRDRIEIDLSDDEITIGDRSTTTLGYEPIEALVVPLIQERRGQSNVGIEARVAVRSGTNQRMIDLIDALSAARVEALYLYSVQDEVRPSMVSSSGGIPTVHLGQPNAQGDLDKAIIRRYIKRNVQKIQYCYEKELLSSPDIAGTVSVQFFIAPTGKVASSAASGVAPRVSSCIANVIQNIEFPKPKGGGGVQVNYPFTLRPNGG
jgi:hypothetical protein